MAYRDDNEALQAKVKGLQEELSGANATIDELQGVADFARPELLRTSSHGFKARARTINGPVEPGMYERIAQLPNDADKPRWRHFYGDFQGP